MGKRQHQKDKLYLTSTEWKTFYGGKKAESGKSGEFKRLPFFCCSLSMQPFEHPYCTKGGAVFDIMNIVPFLKKYGINPCTGEKLSAKDLVKLTFHKNKLDKFHCPVTFRVFNENTHIVAVGTTGNVLSYEAVEKLNIKPNFWKDLISDEPFTRKDIITIQDPTQLEKFNFTKFFHIKKNLKVLDEEEEIAKKDPRYRLKAVNAETRDILDQLDKEYKAPEKQEDDKKKADKLNAAHYSTGSVAAAFTSTAMVRETDQEAAIIDEDIIRYQRIKKKAYVRVLTSCGVLNLELHSDVFPKTCENFLKHIESGYYKGTIFHRSIRNFMIQGGDPTGTGTGGDSIWGQPFADEFKPNITHTGRGILSMANSGPNTNKSQFFFTYRSARHLDNKHTVFGRIVGGIETLDKMEKIETDKKDRPKTEITIMEAQIFVNPYDEADEMLEKEREEIQKKEEEDRKRAKRKAVLPKDTTPKIFKQGVGRYINPASQKSALDGITGRSSAEESAKQKKRRTGFDFTSW